MSAVLTLLRRWTARRVEASLGRAEATQGLEAYGLRWLQTSAAILGPEGCRTSEAYTRAREATSSLHAQVERELRRARHWRRLQVLLSFNDGPGVLEGETR